MRVAQFLSDHQVSFQEILHPPAYRAQRRAKMLRVSGRHVARCALLATSQGFLVAILPATHRMDAFLLERNLPGFSRMATEPEIADIFRDCEWGVVAPFGSLYGIATILDESIRPEDTIHFEGPLHSTALRLRCKDFERLEKPRRLRFARMTHPKDTSRRR